MVFRAQRSKVRSQSVLRPKVCPKSKEVRDYRRLVTGMAQGGSRVAQGWLSIHWSKLHLDVIGPKLMTDFNSSFRTGIFPQNQNLFKSDLKIFKCNYRLYQSYRHYLKFQRN